MWGQVKCNIWMTQHGVVYAVTVFSVGHVLVFEFCDHYFPEIGNAFIFRGIIGTGSRSAGLNGEIGGGIETHNNPKMLVGNSRHVL